MLTLPYCGKHPRNVLRYAAIITMLKAAYFKLQRELMYVSQKYRKKNSASCIHNVEEHRDSTYPYENFAVAVVRTIFADIKNKKP